MSFGEPNNPYSKQPQQPPQGQPGYPQQPQQPGVPPQYGYPQQPAQGQPGQYGYPQQAPQGVPPQGGVPPQYGYPQQQYGAYPPAGMPGAGLPPLANWGQRVGAYLLDLLIIAGPMYALDFIVLASSGSSDAPPSGLTVLSLIGLLYTIGMAIYQIYLEGKTGQTIGKKVLGISLHREADGSTLGFGMAFVRKLAHFLDSIACYIGWLWPLWDNKNQTFADKVCNTVVIKVNKG